MTARMLALLAGLGSAAMLGGALFFQYAMGMAPCQLCIWQRWPHLVALALGLIAWLLPRVWVMGLGAMAVATSGGLGVYHTGVERGWWQGPTTCSGGRDIGTLTPEQLLDLVMAAPVVRCTDVAWEMFGLSMASWNAVVSFALAGLWLIALARHRG